MKAKKKPIDSMSPADLGVDRRPAPEGAEGRRAAQAPGRHQGQVGRRTGRQAEERSGGALNDRPRHRRTRRAAVKPATLTTVGDRDAARAATSHVLVAGDGVKAAAEAAAKIAGVSQGADGRSRRLRHRLAEDVAPLIVELAEGYDAICWPPRPASARTSRRAWRRCWTWRRSPTSSRSIDADTFVRPIYAGNAHGDGADPRRQVKVITVRPTAFDRRRPRAARRRSRPSRPAPMRACPVSSAQELSSPSGPT